MKSIKTKFLALALGSVIAAAFSVGTAGVIILNSHADEDFRSVFSRADREMYINKKKIKELAEK